MSLVVSHDWLLDVSYKKESMLVTTHLLHHQMSFLHHMSVIFFTDINTHDDHAVLTPPPAVDSPRHDVKPAFEDCHLEEGQVGLTHMVEGHRGQGPRGRLLCVSQTGLLVGDQVRAEPLPIRVYALHTKSYVTSSLTNKH